MVLLAFRNGKPCDNYGAKTEPVESGEISADNCRFSDQMTEGLYPQEASVYLEMK